MKLSILIILLGTALLAGCTLSPNGTKEEQTRAQEVGVIYQVPFEKRPLPDLPAEPGWKDVLEQAFLANGDIEAAYFDWRAAIARIDIASAWPNSNVQVGFNYLFSGDKLKAWDRTTLTAGFDPAVSLQLPTKVEQAGQVALDDARAARARFSAAKFDLQKKVLIGYLDISLMEEKIRIARDNVALLKLLTDTANNRVQAGGPQQDLLKSQIEWHLAEHELVAMEAQINSMRAMLNGMMARDAQSPLALPKSLPQPRNLPADDAHLIAIAVDENPDLAVFAQQIASRKDALELARMRYIPDFNPAAAVTGNISQTLGSMVMLPTNLPMIRGAINEAQAMLQSTQAMARQTKNDRAASFVAALYSMRNAERQVMLLQQHILPAAEQMLGSSRQAYAAGSVGFADLIESQRTLLQVRQMVAESRIERERQLASLEALAGVDIETLANAPTTRPTTNPTTREVH